MVVDKKRIPVDPPSTTNTNDDNDVDETLVDDDDPFNDVEEAVAMGEHLNQNVFLENEVTIPEHQDRDGLIDHPRDDDDEEAAMAGEHQNRDTFFKDNVVMGEYQNADGPIEDQLNEDDLAALEFLVEDEVTMGEHHQNSEDPLPEDIAALGGPQPDDECDDAEEPIDGVGCMDGCARDRHMVLTFLTVSLIFTPILWAAGVLGFGVFILIESIIGAWYLWNVFSSNTFQYVRNINTTETVLDYMSRMYRTEPVICWFIQCYHYETRTRQVASPGPNGTTVYYTEFYQERVNTHFASGKLIFSRWTDVSVPLNRDIIERFAMTKISVKKEWTGDAGAYQQKLAFFQVNKRDVFYDFVETIELEGYCARLLGFVDLENIPILADWSWYVISHLTVVFALPYRMWLSSKSNKVRATIKKEIWTS